MENYFDLRIVGDKEHLHFTAYVTLGKTTLQTIDASNHPIGYRTCMSRAMISVASGLEVMIAVNKYLTFSKDGKGMALDSSWMCEWSCIMCTMYRELDLSI